MAGFNLGDIFVTFKANTDSVDKGLTSIKSGLDNAEKNVSSFSAKTAAVFGAIAGVAQTVVTKAMNAVSGSIGSAIKRVDTLNNSTRVFENMGFSAGQVDGAMKALNKSILGLPTSLDSAVSNVQLLTASTNDIGKSQKIFESVNNAVLGFGGNSEMVSNAVVQMSQDFSNGRISAQTWLSMINSGLGPALNAMAKQMGITTGQLKDGLSDGTISVQTFQNALIDMNEKGGGGMASFQKIAKDATSGIGTGWANMQTSIVRGTAKIINAIGAANISGAISSIGGAFEDALGYIAKFITKSIELAKELYNARDSIAAFIKTWAPLITVLGGYLVIIKVYDAIKALQVAFEVMRLITIPSLIATVQAFWGALMANPILLVLALLAGLTVLIVQHWDTVKKIVGEVGDKITGFAKASLQYLEDRIGDLVDAWKAVKDAAEKVFDAIAGWIEKHKKGLTDIAIVIGTILLPKIVSIGVQWTIAAAKAVASFAVMSAQAIAQAAVSSAAWVASAATTAFVWTTQTLPRMILSFATMSAQAVVNAAKMTASFVLSSVQSLASWAITFGAYIVGIAIMVAQTAIAAVAMAASWLLAMGPIGLIVAAAIGAAALIIANWDTVKQWIGTAMDWIKDHWQLVLAIMLGPLGILIGLIIKNWDNIKNAFGNAINGIQGFWNNLVGWFGSAINGIGNVFSKVGDMITAPFKAAFNAIADFWNKTVAKVSFKAPDWVPGIGGKGWSIPSMPHLAMGTPNWRGGAVNMNEFGPETAVLPKGTKVLNADETRRAGDQGGGNTYNLDLSGIIARSGTELADIMQEGIEALDRRLQGAGKPQIMGGRP